MRILMPSSERYPTLNSSPNLMMGTAPAFIVFDSDTLEFYVLENYYLDKKACHLSDDFRDLGITHIMAYKICSPCYSNIIKRGIEVWKDDDSVTIREAFQKFQLGGLKIMQGPGNCRCPRHEAMELRHEQQLEQLI